MPSLRDSYAYWDCSLQRLRLYEALCVLGEFISVKNLLEC